MAWKSVSSAWNDRVNYARPVVGRRMHAAVHPSPGGPDVPSLHPCRHRGRPPLLHPRRTLRLGSVRPPIARRASDEELIATESLALLLTDATWGDPLCSPGRASRISMRDAYKCGFIGCRNATIAASACGDRANRVCGISMDLGLALVGGKVSRFCSPIHHSFALNFGWENF